MSDKLFELKPPEVFSIVRVPFAGRDHVTHHYLRPPTFSEWHDYASRYKSTKSVAEEGIQSESTAVEAACWLYDKIALRQEGYERVPFLGDMDKFAAIRGLEIVAPADLTPEEFEALPFSAEEFPVAITATRSGVRYPRLLHFFRKPTGKQQSRYQRSLATSYLAVDRNQAVKQIQPSNLSTLTALYKELIARVEGYAVDGQPYSGDEALHERMDAQHQRAAVDALFGGERGPLSRLEEEEVLFTGGAAKE